MRCPRQPLKGKETHKVNRKNWNDMMERELGRELRTNINSVRTKVNVVSSNVNTVRSRQPEHPLKNMVDRGIFDSGCSGHMTGNKDQLEDFEEFNRGSVTFGGSKGYISGKGKIRVDNELEFKNRDMLEFCGNKGIKQEYSNARTPQQNGVAERMNRTLIEAARTMLADSLLPTTFWAEAVSTACYIFNRNQANPHAGTSEKTNNAGTSQTLKSNASEEKDEDVKLIVVPSAVPIPKEIVDSRHLPKTVPKNNTTSTPSVNTGSQTVNTGRLDHDDSPMPELKILHSPVQTRSKVQTKSGAHALLSHIQKQQRNNHKDQQHCLFACFLSQEEPKRIAEALQDDSWVQAMQEEFFQVTPKTSHLNAVKRIFKYLKGKPNLGLWYPRESPFDLEAFSDSDYGLQVKQNKGGIFISQDKYVAEILKKFDLVNVKAAITPMETKVPLTKDEEAIDVDVTPKTSHLNAVKRIFKYLKGKPNLGLWYPRESPFDLEAFSDSDYGGSNLDRKSTTGGCQFLGQRLISWQCKKQTIVATSTTEAEYVAAANCCGQVLWVQNQLLDYGFNFMNTKIHIDNESTICIVKNPVYHSKTKHIEIRHHFIRDCYEKKLISVEKIHTDLNVADLLTKPFDGPRFNYLVVSIGFAEIVDFLRGSNLRYALTSNPPIYDSLVKQFWQTATANTKADGTLEINATIDTIRYTITEASIRDSLQLADATGITMLPNDEIFEGMGQMGYPTDGTFTFWKSFFTPQWRYLVHHLLHCISSKSGGWDQFGSNIATALIYEVFDVSSFSANDFEYSNRKQTPLSGCDPDQKQTLVGPWYRKSD
ncbi:putative ribonuclease H-like domain-containing protein [Tanacetum coccineum]